jgi:hypothetical protein
VTSPVRLDPAVVEILAEWVPREDLRSMRVIRSWPLRWLPALIGMTAVTLAPFVIFRAGGYRPFTAAGLALIAHEACHIRQVREMGRPRFYATYLLGQLRSGFRHDRHPLEIPCIELQRTVRATLRARGFPG